MREDETETPGRRRREDGKGNDVVPESIIGPGERMYSVPPLNQVLLTTIVESKGEVPFIEDSWYETTTNYLKHIPFHRYNEHTKPLISFSIFYRGIMYTNLPESHEYTTNSSNKTVLSKGVTIRINPILIYERLSWESGKRRDSCERPSQIRLVVVTEDFLYKTHNCYTTSLVYFTNYGIKDLRFSMYKDPLIK